MSHDYDQDLALLAMTEWSGLAWQVARGWTRTDGSVFVRVMTNDEFDRGYPSGHGEWEFVCASRMDFDRRCGVSRTGSSGVKVDVYLDGQRLF